MSQSTNLQEPSAAPNQEKIASLAYALWVERGCPEGTPDVDWLEAEKELRELQDQSSGRSGDGRTVLHPQTPHRETHNMALERYRLKTDAVAVRGHNVGKQEIVVVPAGSHVFADVPFWASEERLMNVVWNGEDVIMFTTDIKARAELVPAERELIYR